MGSAFLMFQFPCLLFNGTTVSASQFQFLVGDHMGSMWRPTETKSHGLHRFWVWLQDLLLHECTVRFRPAVLRQHLGHIYIFFSLIISPHHLGWAISFDQMQSPSIVSHLAVRGLTDCLLLPSSHFSLGAGWPVHRPRRYTIGVKKGTLLFDHERSGWLSGLVAGGVELCFLHVAYVFVSPSSYIQ